MPNKAATPYLAGRNSRVLHVRQVVALRLDTHNNPSVDILPREDTRQEGCLDIRHSLGNNKDHRANKDHRLAINKDLHPAINKDLHSNKDILLRAISPAETHLTLNLAKARSNNRVFSRLRRVNGVAPVGTPHRAILRVSNSTDPDKATKEPLVNQDNSNASRKGSQQRMISPPQTLGLTLA